MNRTEYSPGNMFLKAAMEYSSGKISSKVALALVSMFWICFCMNVEVAKASIMEQAHHTKLTYPTDKVEPDSSARFENILHIEKKKRYSTITHASSSDKRQRKRRSVGLTFKCAEVDERIAMELVCNGYYDCSDKSDEENCQAYTCPSLYNRCTTGQCYLSVYQCDGEKDCPDNSDEANCHNATCSDEYFRCKSGQCVFYPLRCDGKPDCHDSSDEAQCEHITCPEGYHKCFNGRCMSQVFLCEFIYEINIWIHSHGRDLPCSKEFTKNGCKSYICADQDHFQCGDGHCIPSVFHCDNMIHCADRSDENACKGNTCTGEKQHDFLCKSGHCIPNELRCDVEKDCLDRSDEATCIPDDCGSQRFFCTEGHCISKMKVCDMKKDCIDGDDETNCDKTSVCTSSEYQCQSGHCISMYSHLCNGYFQGLEMHCPIFHDDEEHCHFVKCPSDYLRFEMGGCVQQVPSNITCAPSGSLNHCPHDCSFSNSYLQCCDCRCVHRVSICDGIPDCPDGEDERHCGRPDCRADQFYCDNITCFPLEFMCDGFSHCPGGHDEVGCGRNESNKLTQNDISVTGHDNVYPSTYSQQACFDPEVCLNKHDICNYFGACSDMGNINKCFLVCPRQCICFPSGFIQCNQWGTKQSSESKSDKVWPFRNFVPRYNIYTYFMRNPILTFQKILILDITDANLTEVPSRTLSCAFNIQQLNLSHNLISKISVGDFGRLYRLSILDLSHNLITEIEDFAFKGMRVFNLWLDNNLISKFGFDLFSGMAVDGKIYTDEVRLCCLKPDYFPATNCFPKADQCKNLMKNGVLGKLLWITGLLVLIGNCYVLLSKMFIEQESFKTKYGILVTNLAIADLLMAAYLLSIASLDTKYRDYYMIKDAEWRYSPWCSVVGVVCMVSSEASMLFICLITMERYIALKYAIGKVGLSRLAVICLSVGVWISAVAISVIPVTMSSYFKGQFFNKSGVCIALPLITDSFEGWKYSFAISVCLNFGLFLVIFVGQCLIYKEIITGKQKPDDSSKHEHDFKVAKRLMPIVISDFVCWAPIGVMGIMALTGFPIPVSVYEWVIVLVVPFNAVLNPFLYTGMSQLSKCKDQTDEEQTDGDGEELATSVNLTTHTPQ